MDINAYRQRINELDEEIVRLLNERAECARAIGQVKEDTELATFAPAREAEVLDHILRVNQGPIEQEAMGAIYHEIISACRALERPTTISYWGPPASNTHVAARQRFGGQARYVPAETISRVFSQVEQGHADFGVVPVENSTEGVVTHTLDSFLETNLLICAEVYVQIHHHLLSHASSLADVQRVYTMPQATAQCRSWLAHSLPHVELVEVTTTARAAEVAAHEAGAAAIANKTAAEFYGLNILAERIEDNPRNRTRFLVLGHIQPPPTGKDKTSLLFAVRHEAGALYRALSPFEKYDISMTMIESRPTKLTPWEYVFFIDLQGHVETGADSAMRRALAQFQQQCLYVKVLGSYPEAE
ncbi:MAG: prephenate dehydratase [Armatimonadetes bacterium]|nr:prephenate dehydratase [Armatimonadota bacterium]